MAAPPEPERPHVHFTPPTGWMNDPNGLVHVDGTWHLHYQHHPGSLTWGPMHWGHATSRDLVSWDHHPVALAPDHLGAAFSGSVVVDDEGTAGFGAGALVALFTHATADAPQAQGVAISTDHGTTWSTYAGNPVLEAPTGLVDFRDPKVFRWGGSAGHWVMVVAGGREVIVHRSDDLLAWRECSRFGAGRGAHEGVWETPDLFELEVEDTGDPHWVLVVSVLHGGPAGGSGTQYFVGSFDGERFRSDDPDAEVRWVDHGADFYAPQSWHAAPAGRRVWVAWMSNWEYAEDVPASTWRGVMTVPRDVLLRRGEDGRPWLAQAPAPELHATARVVSEDTDLTVTPDQPWTRTAPSAYELRLQGVADAPWAVEVDHGDGRSTRVVIDPVASTVAVERPDTGPGSVKLAGPQVASLPTSVGDVELRIVVDTCSVEVFAHDGRAVLTALVPTMRRSGVAVTATRELHLSSLALLDLTREEDGGC